MTAATAYAPGTIGIGVGKTYPGIPERGEPDVVFHSIVWFPADALDQAHAFADESGYVVQEGVPL